METKKLNNLDSVNIVEIATDIAYKLTILSFSNPLKEAEAICSDGKGGTMYTDKAQEYFDREYDYWYSIINNNFDQKLYGEVYTCSNCGSEKVESTGWIGLNDHTITEFDENELYHCQDCHSDKTPIIKRVKLKRKY